MSDRPLTLMAVHAHPDDEAIGTGGILARYADEGVRTVLVTCTNGELGDAPGGLKPGDPGHDERVVVALRRRELEASCEVLGVSHLELLGYHDSGMQGWPQNEAPGSFWATPVEAPARRLADLMRRYEPQVVVTYDENGFYGHPDHIQAHRVAWRAFELADGAVAKFYATTVPRSVLAAGIEAMRAARQNGNPAGGGPDFTGVDSADDLPFGVPDEIVTTEIDATAHLEQKLDAMRAHATQIAVDSPFFAFSDNLGQRALGREYYTLLAGTCGRGSGPHDRESDLFAAIG
jgi:N-acetyl-1-D-myo-inositol-2-amino-2-deoxy-alpha-D-glucopyranoside deacetylase